ncbi:hypothetical protein PVAND_015037 [Polypedilum vanderplanki]|uniref:Uncharacterized protein n=1 Tax=Polypedilum vanderplanki TaxID=319348 RepID=A0A9J6BB27_POLVA|nr:hypothetical protein PVAND_015037 [Polypedilum vanderplanki]
MKIIIFFLIILACSLSLILSAPGSVDPVKLTRPTLTTTTLGTTTKTAIPMTTTSTVKETTTVSSEKPSKSIQQSTSDKNLSSSSEESSSSEILSIIENTSSSTSIISDSSSIINASKSAKEYLSSCPSYECRKCSIFDSETCTCTEIECLLFGTILDENCNCVCNLTDAGCPSGTSLNIKNCLCIEISSSSSEELSPTSESSSEESSSEESSTEPNYTEDLPSSTEEMFSSCSYIDCVRLNGKCSYFDHYVCACAVFDCFFGYTFDDNCNCVCNLTDADCPPGTSINPPYCYCTSSSKSYTSSEKSTSSSESSIERTSSSSEELPLTSESTNESYCDVLPSCKPCDMINYELCECIPLYVDCFGGFILTEDGCNCYCPLNQSTCPPNTIFLSNICECEHIDISSMDSFPESMTPSNEESSSLKCHQQKCLENEEWSQEHCSCVCRKNIECQPGYIFDSLICNCIPEHEPSCPEKFVYNSTLCECVCAEMIECDNLKVFDSDLCSCVCPSDAKINCENGQFNSETCQCIE